MRVRRSLAAAALVPLLLLAACGEDEPQPKLPEPSATPTPTASESSTAVQESPEDFIRRFFAADERLQKSGKTGSFLAMTDGCSSCEELAALVHSYYQSGGFVRWDGWTIKAIKELNSTPQHASFRVEAISGPTEYRESAKGPLKRFPGEEGAYLLELRSAGSSWSVTDRSKFNS